MNKTSVVTEAPRDWVTVLLFGLALLLISGDYGKTCAQEQHLTGQPATTAKQGGTANVLHAGNRDYRLGSGDDIQIQIDKAPELSGIFHISTDGTVLMPYLGRLVAHSKTPEELSLLIADGLRDRYLRTPRVVVDVVRYNSSTFFIQGAVRSPGVYQIAGRPTLFQLISFAGGPAENHGASAFVIRERIGDAVASVGRPDKFNDGQLDPSVDGTAVDWAARHDLITVNIAGLTKGNLSQNIELHPGDIVSIPPTDVFFVAGEVRLPGQYPLKAGTRLSQAISIAAGTTAKAAPKRGVIFREEPGTGKQREIRVDIGAVMRGKQEDLVLVANDMIVVPNSKVKSAASVILNGLGGNAVPLIVNVARTPVP